ncbi:NAD(P)-binding protein [Staphylococcus edaphicus]|uniref:precorrin-2 dehydrogenase n=1 Tax=Staphylococcus edaphicus TaxID=1955013 RepID=A0A2C6WM24_9STAP|nr:NAD(P)-binding protein [Staphylococcus edaphicus]PHK48497.1 precorrin-2 dehydrogenase [Staphylococcus edaphicus]UQW81496.1 NAD(P)-binding protein [Staphylococcus edaphicus]
MPMIPLMIDISEKQVVVIGGGKIAERRVRTLISYTDKIRVVSPSLTIALQDLLDNNWIQWDKKTFEPKDIEQADLIIVATNHAHINQQVLLAKPHHALTNMTSEAATGDVAFPSILRRGKLTLSISTNGASPTLTAQILEEFKSRFDNSYEDYVDFLYECRLRIKQTHLSTSQKQNILKMILTQPYREKNKQLEMIKRLESMT